MKNIGQMIDFDKKLTDTLDIHGGQEDLGEDKRAV